MALHIRIIEHTHYMNNTKLVLRINHLLNNPRIALHFIQNMCI